jgi:hypothetical protein
MIDFPEKKTHTPAPLVLRLERSPKIGDTIPFALPFVGSIEMKVVVITMNHITLSGNLDGKRFEMKRRPRVVGED